MLFRQNAYALLGKNCLVILVTARWETLFHKAKSLETDDNRSPTGTFYTLGGSLFVGASGAAKWQGGRAEKRGALGER